MTNIKKEVAKFFSGVAAMQVLVHGAFALTGSNYTILGFTLSGAYNTFAVVLWAMVLVLLIYYAWIKR